MKEPDRIPVTVSVIICARNEQANIEKCLLSILENDCPHLLECIVVNDASTDLTSDIVTRLSKDFTKIRLIDLPARETAHPKRDALLIGVSEAKGQLLLFTDADCIVKPGWVKKMLNAYCNGNDFISGPVVYVESNSFFEKLQALNYMILQGIGGSSFLLNRPVMCSGANLAVTKNLFNKLIQSGQVASGAGEDMWLLESLKKYKSAKSTFLKDRQSIVCTYPERRLGGFVRQQQRWGIKNKRYKDFDINLSMTIIAGHFIFLLISLILSCFYDKFANLIGFQIILQLVIDYVSWWRFAVFFERKNLMWNFLPLQIIRLPFYLFIGCSIMLNRFSWKGRSLK
jgi:glycosyltransferase involved in cell wall biosynthesis